jgi:glyoxylase-like metal-dependent hydrolase (beta-lactamase superfamily II)
MLGAAFAGGLPAAGLLPGVAQASTNLTLTPLTGRLSLVQGGASNIVVASTGSQLLLVDGGAATDSKALQKLLARYYPGQKLQAVINSHWHRAQTGFNATARQAGVDVIAHENTKLWLGTEVNSRWEGKVYAAQPATSLPNRTFYYGAQTLDFGGTKVEYVHLGQAHTDGDIYVRFPEENVIVAGDVVSPGRYPIVDSASNGWLGGIRTALKTVVARCDANTKVVPGLGPVVNVDAVRQQEEMCFNVITRIGDSYYKGQTWEELVASNPTREFDAQYGDPKLFLRQSYDTAWYHVGEIRRVVR